MSCRQHVDRLERVLQPHPPGKAALNLTARRLRNGTGANEHDRVERDLVFVRNSLADAADDLIDLEVAAMDALHLLYEDDER